MFKRKQRNYQQSELTPIHPQYEFRIVEATKNTYIVEAETTNYNYGEDLADFGWTNAGMHPTLKYDFAQYYRSLDSAIYAVKHYRGEEIVVWQENNQPHNLNQTQKERLNSL